MTTTLDTPTTVPRRTRRAKRRTAVATVAVVAVAAAVTAVTVPRKPATNNGGTQDNAYPTALATVTLGTLTAQTSVTGTLSYAGSYSVVNQATGTFTGLPAIGQLIRDGQVLYRVSDAPVLLLYGTVPAYRTLQEGMTGPDVRQLNRDLVALGYASKADLDPTSDYFSAETAYALELLQNAHGETETGTLTLGQAVFAPTSLRITGVQVALGTPASPGAPAFTATSIQRDVTIALDATQQSYIKRGDRVTITLPGSQTTPGLVSSVGTVAVTPAGGGAATVTVDVTPSHPAATGSLDRAQVQVAITTATVPNALSVPVTALLALAGGGYAVEVADSGGLRHPVPVSLGLFDDTAGLVQVTGSGLAPGQRVVVPAS